MNQQEIKLDVSKRAAVAPTLALRQGDRNGTELAVKLYDGGSPLDLEGYGARLCLRLPRDGGYYECDGTASGNVATFEVDETYAASTAGRSENCYVSVLDGEEVVCSTGSFPLVVLPSAEEGADPSTAYASGIREATEAANQAADDANAAAGRANQAADDASGAADLAGGKAVDAESAATKANAATADANAAATAANNEAANASAAAERADQSALSADRSASSADSAAADAREAAEAARGGLPNLTAHAEGESVTLDGAVGARLASFSVGGRSVQGDSPSPDSPQEVRSVGGGGNLLPPVLRRDSGNGITVTRNGDGSYHVEGTSWGEVYFFLSSGTGNANRASDAFPVSGGAAYTVSGAAENVDVGAGFCSRSAADSESIYAVESVRVSGGESATVTTDPSVEFCYAYIHVANKVTVDTDVYPQVEQGPAATSWKPYAGVLVDGRNLLDPAKFIAVSGGPDAIDSDGYMTDSTPDSDGRSWYWSSRNFEITLAAGTYTLTAFNAIAPTSNSAKFIVWDDSYSKLTECEIMNSVSRSATFTLSKSMVIGIEIKVYDGKTRLQLERGTEAHDYAPYHAPYAAPIPLQGNELHGLPDGTRDELHVDAAGHVSVVRKCGYVVFDGSESWDLQNSGKRVCIRNGMSGIENMPPSSNGEAYNGLSTHFPAVSGDSTWAGKAGFSGQIGVIGEMHFSDGTGGMTVDSWKTWLESNPVTVYYPLATEQTIDLGYIDLEASDGDTLSILSPATPAIGAAWWVEPTVPAALEACEGRVEAGISGAGFATEGYVDEAIDEAIDEALGVIADGSY